MAALRELRGRAPGPIASRANRRAPRYPSAKRHPDTAVSWNISVRAHDVLAVIMGGGAGTRLFPLTKDRAKPAVPLAGKYRLVDIPISNCLNSDLRRIFLLTQFNSGSLHRHIQESYRFDSFSPGFVEILAAEQRPGRMDWYQGTADAVRQNLHAPRFLSSPPGPHSFRRPALPDGFSRRSSSSTSRPGPRSRWPRRRCARRRRAHSASWRSRTMGAITRFVEKPKDPAVLATLARAPRRSPRLDGYLRLRPRGPGRGALGNRGRLRQARHPQA